MAGTINGRPYLVKFAVDLEKGEKIWVQTELGQTRWTVHHLETSGTMVMVHCKEGQTMHERLSGVFVDIGRNA